MTSAMVMAAVLFLSALLIHEAGHAIACLACGVEIKRLLVSRRGIGIVRAPSGPAASAVIAIAGPLANLLAATALQHDFAFVSLVNAALQLLPLANSDGTHFVTALRHLRATAAEKG
jgi:Zn-dependent protease